MGKTWRPRRPAKAPLEAAGVKDAQGVAVIPVVDGKVEASVVAAAKGEEKVPMEEAAGVKDAQGVAVGKMWRPRRAAKAPLKAVGVKDGEVQASVLGAPVVAAAKGGQKGPMEDGTAVCRMDALDGAPVGVASTRQEAAGFKDANGVAVGKMWRPRRPAKAPLEAGPMAVAVRGGEKGPLEDGIAICQAVGVKDTKGVAVGKIWRPRRPAKAPLQALGLKDAEGVAVITVDGEVEASVTGAPVVVVAEDGEKGTLEEGIMLCQVDALDGAPVIAMTQQEAVGVKDGEGIVVGKMWLPRRPAKAPLEAVGVKDAERVAVITVDGKVGASVIGAPVFVAAGDGEKGPLEEGIMVCQVDTLDGAPVIAMTQQEALRVKDAERVAVITVDGEVEPLVLGVPVVTAAEEGEKGSLEDGIVVCQMDALVITTDEKEEVSVRGDPPVFPAVDQNVDALVVEGVTVEGDGKVEKDEEGITVKENGKQEKDEEAITVKENGKEEKDEEAITVKENGKEEKAITVKENGKEEKDEEGITVKENGNEEKDEERIKCLKHYSTAQSILIVGDGDFSFSLALATAFGSGGNLVATSLDDYGLLTIKYGKAESNIRELKRLGATVLHGVDAKTMKLHSYLEMRRFDRIVFNFPHAGFRGRENRLHAIKAHQQLVHAFFANARQLLRPNGEIHLSHKTGSPYDEWDIEQLAYESCLVMVQKVDFSRDDYPGYNQKKGDGVTCDESFPLGPCCTYMFCVGDVEKLKQAHGNRKKLKQAHGNRKKLKQKQAHGNRVGSISSCLGGSEFYPGISATDMMWPYNLHPAWPQPHFPPVHLPIAFDPSPFGVAEMEHPVNCYGTSFYQHDMVQPTHQEQPWYQEGPPIEPPWTPQGHQSQQSEYEIHRQLTLSLEDRYMESVEGQAMLETLTPVA